tara:strand:+ start:438 stop:695 length:258 start_codon:yes stop_codon:yes gene_type:complete
MLKETRWGNFFSDCACYIMNESMTFKIDGNKQLAESTGYALAASKKLYDVLCCEDASIIDVKNAITNKKKAAQVFYATTGISWPF